MIYLSGGFPDVADSATKEFGYMLSPHNCSVNRQLPNRLWAADNGCFALGDQFSPEKFYYWLAKRAVHRATCLFAVAPDVVGDARKTLKRSLPALPVIRAMGYSAAFVAQDGIEHIDIPWDEFDCLFMGGSTEFKLSEQAYAVITEAKRRGKWAHQGRCNSWTRFRAAAVSGYDSADGTNIAFAPDRELPKVLAWLGQLDRQPHLWTA